MSRGMNLTSARFQQRNDALNTEEPAMNSSVVHLVWVLMVTAIVACLALVLVTSCDIGEKLLLFTWTLSVGAMMIGVFLHTKDHPPLNRYLVMLLVYVFIAFPLKATLSQIPFMSEIIEGYFIPKALFSESLIPAIAYTTGVLIAVGILLSMPYLGKPKKKSLLPRRFNYSLFLIVIGASLVVKVIAHYVLIWGVPNRPPQNVIPLVTGMTKMYVTLGIFHLLNVAIAHLAIRGGKLNQKILVGVLSFAFVGIDWGIGSKYSTVYFLVTIITTAVLTTRTIKTKASTLFFIGILALVAFSAYPVVHSYRFAKKERPNASLEKLVSRSIATAIEKEDNYFALGGFLKIVQRVNGFQNHCSAISYHRQLDFRYRDLISSADASSRYTIAVTGIKHEANTFGITQSGMASGLFRLQVGQIFFYSVIMNTMFIFFLMHCIRRLSKPYENWLATGVSIGLFIVFSQFHGGNFLFIGKQGIVLLFAVWLANFFFFRPRPQAYAAPR